MIIMEYCEQGNLLSYQANLPGRVFELNHAIQIMVEIMKGLKWIHESTYVHRDIKSENILLKK
jgi:serine/threonine protein kinase